MGGAIAMSFGNKIFAGERACVRACVRACTGYLKLMKLSPREHRELLISRS